MDDMDETTTGRPTNWTVRAVYDPVSMVYDVYIFERGAHGVHAMTNKGTVETVNEGEPLPVFTTLHESNDDFLEIFKKVEYYGYPRRRT